MDRAVSWSDVGELVAEARRSAGYSQEQVAAALGIDRTAVVRMESGDRKVSALEVMRLAELFDVPAGYFLSPPSAAVVSRRARLGEDSGVVSRERFRMDVALDAHTRDTEWLVAHQFLTPAEPFGAGSPADAPEALARAARRRLGRPEGPLGAMATTLEAFGLYLVVVDEEGEGASRLLEGFGVAVIGGRAEPGRRRWTAAHELGHHLLQDEYHSDAGVAASKDEREQLIDRFVGEFLLPEHDLREAWETDDDRRKVLVGLSGRYRISWRAMVSLARRHGLLDGTSAQRMRANTPVKGDFLAVCGHEPTQDLDIGATGAQWRRAVLAAYTSGAITGQRAVELMHGALAHSELPMRADDQDQA